MGTNIQLLFGHTKNGKWFLNCKLTKNNEQKRRKKKRIRHDRVMMTLLPHKSMQQCINWKKKCNNQRQARDGTENECNFKLTVRCGQLAVTVIRNTIMVFKCITCKPFFLLLLLLLLPPNQQLLIDYTLHLCCE